MDWGCRAFFRCTSTIVPLPGSFSISFILHAGEIDDFKFLQAVVSLLLAFLRDRRLDFVHQMMPVGGRAQDQEHQENPDDVYACREKEHVIPVAGCGGGVAAPFAV
jgi:hypothetical protein